jgi:hypothetical protein
MIPSKERRAGERREEEDLDGVEQQHGFFLCPGGE